MGQFPCNVKTHAAAIVNIRPHRFKVAVSVYQYNSKSFSVFMIHFAPVTFIEAKVDRLI